MFATVSRQDSRYPALQKGNNRRVGGGTRGKDKSCFRPQLYYGDQELCPFLQGVKKRYDPNNIFHFSMSVRA